jgi:signal transduction histidine kinase
LFFISRKKIIQKEFRKKDLEIQYQKSFKCRNYYSGRGNVGIAQDLHDDISSKLNIVSLNSLVDQHYTQIHMKLQQILSILQGKPLDNSRKIAHGLLPPVLEKFGLHAGAKNYVWNLAVPKP